MASSTNGLSEAEIQMNLKALRKVAFFCETQYAYKQKLVACKSKRTILLNSPQLDPCIQAIMAHSSQVLFFLYMQDVPVWKPLNICSTNIDTQVQLYKYISKNSSDGDWVQTKVYVGGKELG